MMTIQYDDYAALLNKNYSDMLTVMVNRSKDLSMTVPDAYNMVTKVATRREVIDTIDSMLAKTAMATVSITVKMFKDAARMLGDVVHFTGVQAKAFATSVMRVNGKMADRKSTRLNSRHIQKFRMPSSA